MKLPTLIGCLGLLAVGLKLIGHFSQHMVENMKPPGSANISRKFFKLSAFHLHLQQHLAKKTWANRLAGVCGHHGSPPIGVSY